MNAQVYGIKQGLWDFALETIDLYRMDDSHGIRHFVCVVLYTRLIMQSSGISPVIPGLTTDAAAEIVIDAAFVHDLVDRKYTPAMLDYEAADAPWPRLRAALLVYHTPQTVEMIRIIIDSVSWSKRRGRLASGLPPIEPGPLAAAIGIVADADQLDAYDVNRCKKYQTEHFRRIGLWGQQYEHLCRQRIKSILVNRVLLYRDHYFSTAAARLIAGPLHLHVEAYVAAELSDVNAEEIE
jgi:hypothetical protein